MPSCTHTHTHRARAGTPQRGQSRSSSSSPPPGNQKTQLGSESEPLCPLQALSMCCPPGPVPGPESAGREARPRLCLLTAPDLRGPLHSPVSTRFLFCHFARSIEGHPRCKRRKRGPERWPGPPVASSARWWSQSSGPELSEKLGPCQVTG